MLKRNKDDKNRKRNRRIARYLILYILNLGLIWTPVMAYVLYAPVTYKSTWSLILPGSGTGSSVNLDNLGQASTSVASAYASTSVDPKVNYKAIAMSNPVIKRAAEYAGITPAEFGKPVIKLVDQTAIIEFTHTANSAELAHGKASSLLDAFTGELDDLRDNEVQTRRDGSLSSMSEYRENVKMAQDALLEFKTNSNLVSAEQFNTLSANIEDILRQQTEAKVEATSLDAQLSEFLKSLDIDVRQAVDAIRLQNDPIFQSHLLALSAVNKELVENMAIWGNKHPKVRMVRARELQSRRALLDRAREFTEIEDMADIGALVVNGGSESATLYRTVIELLAAKTAAITRIETYEQQIIELEKRLKDHALSTAQLEDLERSHQVATAVFVSALAKTDLGRSDIYASYPMTQVLVSPTMPAEPEKLFKVFAILGAFAGSLFILAALFVMWKRSQLIHRILKKK